MVGRVASVCPHAARCSQGPLPLPPPPFHTQDYCTYALPGDALAAQLEQLWRQGALVDVRLCTQDGSLVAAHRLLLAAECGYFRALFLGAGAAMREASDSGAAVQLQHASGEQLALLVEALYCRRLQVRRHGHRTGRRAGARGCSFVLTTPAPPPCSERRAPPFTHHRSASVTCRGCWSWAATWKPPPSWRHAAG